MPSPVAALVVTTGRPEAFAAASISASGLRRSHWLMTMITGVPSVFARRISSASAPTSSPPRTINARSTHSSTERLRRTRAAPNSPTSSTPAVSMKTTGPTGASSQAFSTGSVVVPATFETMEIC